ncbi:hypothetical protein [Nonomuraea recticatena]|uniref:hypothetical protein n=1 Tax=Nonomuraea recticatena TaxID=46178 RepID=UPI0031F730A5
MIAMQAISWGSGHLRPRHHFLNALSFSIGNVPFLFERAGACRRPVLGRSTLESAGRHSGAKKYFEDTRCDQVVRRKREWPEMGG